MAYTVERLKEGVLKVEFIDVISEEDAIGFAAGVQAHLRPEKGAKQLDVLIDTSSADSKLAPKTRRILTEYNKNPLIGNHAVVGINRALKVMATFIVKASGRNNIRFFDTEAEALDWLEKERKKAEVK